MQAVGNLLRSPGNFMLDLLKNAWVGIVWWFHPDMAHGVFWGSLLITFVASVMGKDQQQRLEQGKFGLAAGTSLGGLSALLKDQKELLVVGFVGSAIGGLLGWLYYLALASLLVRSPKLGSLVFFQIGGLEGLQKKLDVESKQNLRAGFHSWSEKLSRMIAEMGGSLLDQPAQDDWEEHAIMVIRSWLASAVDALALVFGTLTDKPEYQSRVTIIVYRRSADHARAAGKHWISYSGQLTPHVKDIAFDETSIGYRVLTQKIPSPYFTTKQSAQKEGQARVDDPSYRPFITFRLNDSAVLAVDWPEALAESDYYVQSARSLFYAHVTPAITALLDHWPRPLADAADVAALPEPVGRPAPAGPAPEPLPSPSPPPASAEAETRLGGEQA